MRVTLYDFDKTIYRGDSAVDFYFFCLKRHPGIVLGLPALVSALVRHRQGKIPLVHLKEIFYSFLPRVPDIGRELSDFWDAHEKKITFWRKTQQPENPVVISASPEFLLRPICEKLRLGRLIASRVNPNTGKYTGENCKGQEKVRRLLLEIPDADVLAFYSDSLSDAPLARMSKKAYLIQRGRILNWPEKGCGSAGRGTARPCHRTEK
jgi:phosphoserine phosphatase